MPPASSEFSITESSWSRVFQVWYNDLRRPKTTPFQQSKVRTKGLGFGWPTFPFFPFLRSIFITVKDNKNWNLLREIRIVRNLTSYGKVERRGFSVSLHYYKQAGGKDSENYKPDLQRTFQPFDAVKLPANSRPRSSSCGVVITYVCVWFIFRLKSCAIVHLLMRRQSQTNWLICSLIHCLQLRVPMSLFSGRVDEFNSYFAKCGCLEHLYSFPCPSVQ